MELLSQPFSITLPWSHTGKTPVAGGLQIYSNFPKLLDAEQNLSSLCVVRKSVSSVSDHS